MFAMTQLLASVVAPSAARRPEPTSRCPRPCPAIRKCDELSAERRCARRPLARSGVQRVSLSRIGAHTQNSGAKAGSFPHLLNIAVNHDCCCLLAAAALRILAVSAKFG